MKAQGPNGQRGETGASVPESKLLDTTIHKKRRQERFLAAFAACGSILRACQFAKVHRQTHYFWMRTDSSYPRRFEQARAHAVQVLEDEAVRGADQGIKRLVLYQGKPVYIHGEPFYETEYSNPLLLRLLEAHAPDRWARRTETIDLLKLDPTCLSEAQLDRISMHMAVRWYQNEPEKAAAALTSMGIEIPASLRPRPVRNQS